MNRAYDQGPDHDTGERDRRAGRGQAGQRQLIRWAMACDDAETVGLPGAGGSGR